MSSASSFQHEPFRELLQNLYEEPYAKRHHFSNLTLEEIEKHLCLHNGNLELPQSFQSCRETFILILHTLEILGLSEFPKLEAPEKIQQQQQQPASSFSHTLAEQYHKVAEFFLSKTDFPFPDAHRTRIIIENLCFCVEAEGQRKIGDSLRAFWMNRDYEVERLFEPGTHELSSQIVDAVEKFSSQHNQFLYEGRFPIIMVTSTLNYLRAVNSEEPLLPSALELACLLLFFGQTVDFEEFSLHNVLFADGLEPEETIELAFRLLRIQKNKNRVLSTGFLPTPQHLLAVQEDCQRVLDLFSRLQFLESGKLRSVA